MKKITKDVLEYLNNNHTKIIEKEDFKGNYYSFLTDTIYLAKNFENTKVPKEVENVDKRVGNLIVIVHECIHSIQSKIIHILNIIFSNLTIILGILSVMLALFNAKNQAINIITEIIVLFGIIVRLYLEIEAINKSTIVAKEIVKKYNIDINVSDFEKSEKYMKKTKLFAIIDMIKDKIIVFVIVGLIIII